MNNDNFIKNGLNVHETKNFNRNLGVFTCNGPCYFQRNKKTFSNCNRNNVTGDRGNLPYGLEECRYMDSSQNFNGMILRLNINLKNIYSNKIIIIAVLIYENEKLYALKTKKIQTGYYNDCVFKNFCAGQFYFIFQENGFCRNRKFRVKIMYHYIES